jgi:hypothetical protein
VTIYNYVANKDALYELVVNHVMGTVRIPEPDEGGWEDRLKELERGARRAMGELPGLSLDRRDSAEGRRLAEGVTAILDDAGFTQSEAMLAFAALFTFMVGQIDVDVDDSRSWVSRPPARTRHAKVGSTESAPPMAACTTTPASPARRGTSARTTSARSRTRAASGTSSSRTGSERCSSTASPPRTRSSATMIASISNESNAGTGVTTTTAAPAA